MIAVYRKPNGKYYASIRLKGRQYVRGYEDDAISAAVKRNQLLNDLFGESGLWVWWSSYRRPQKARPARSPLADVVRGLRCASGCPRAPEGTD